MSPTDAALAALVAHLPLTLSLWGLRRRTPRQVTPADWVTLLRAVGACACAFVTMLAILGAVTGARPERTWLLVAIAVPTLMLDGVDGWVARRTNSASDAGARFDMELDAGMVLILSIAAALTLGLWVLVVGFARYLYGAAALIWPWLETPLPPSWFRKTVAATQGIALVIALAPITPVRVATGLAAVALTLLAVSFIGQTIQARRVTP